MCNKRNSQRIDVWDFYESEDKTVRLDSCIAHEVAVLSDTETPTLACCCGHGRYKKTIVVPTPDGDVMEWFSKKIIPRKKKFYVRDADGFYYIPEVES